MHVRALTLVLLAGCITPPEPGVEPSPDAALDPNVPSEHEDPAAAQGAFERAALAFDVPVELLAAIAATETRLEMVDGLEEFPGRPTTVGLMGLRSDRVAKAARLADISEHAVRTMRAHNVAAAAALLSTWADAEDIDRADLGAWASVVARYSGIDGEEGRAQYVFDGVYAHLAQGIKTEELSFAARDVVPDFPRFQAPARATGSQRSYARWRPSPNTSARPGGIDPGMVIIHSCEGAYAGCWSWLADTRSGVSAHYVVNERGTEVSQLVHESRKAWHISASYDCGRNDGVDCWRNGSSGNNFTVGIEHAGRANQSSWDPGLLDVSARLVCDIATDHDIPLDTYHVVSHGQLQPWNRIDPGPNWPWARYLADAQQRCGGGGTAVPTPSPAPAPSPTGAITVDSNNARNDTSRGYVEVGGTWSPSANVGGYYGTGYWWRTTGATSDPASFWFQTGSEGCYTVQAWWTAASDRSPTAPWLVIDPSDQVIGRATVDQRSGGSRWNTLGTWTLPAGWNRVALSRWTTPGKVVVADAVRLLPATGCAVTAPPALPDPVEIIVDSDQSLNGPDADVDYSASWTSAAATPDFYGSDYVWHETEATYDPMSFWFHLDQPLRVIVDARWTAGSNRSTEAPFVILDADGRTRTVVRVDQTQSHGTWVELGAWDLPAGWNRVALSTWTAAPGVVVGDAVRVREVR